LSHEERLTMKKLETRESRFFFRVSLTPNLSCAIINCVEIEVICPLLKRGKNHKGLGKISTSKNCIPPLLKFQY
jgi:hypothetical protein